MRLQIGRRNNTNNTSQVKEKMYSVGYTRVSSEEQVSNYSLETQEEEITKASKQLGYTLLKTFSDPGRSAKTIDRPGIHELLKYIRQDRRITALFIYQISRLSRSTLDYLYLKKQLADRGVKIISTHEPIDASPTGEFLETVLAGMARLDNAMKSKRSLDGMRKRLEDGWAHGRAPMGYENVEKNGRHIIRPDRYFLHCQSAWLKFESGLYTPQQITEYLKERNVKVTWGSKVRPVTEKQVWRMLKNPFYTGLIQHKQFGTYQGKHQAMIGLSTFNKAQDILSGRSTHQVSPRKYLSDSFPLRQFIQCPDCGKPMTGAYSRSKTGKRHPYYFCSVHRKSIKRRLAHQKIIKLLHRIKPTQEFMTIFTAKLKEKWGRERQELQQAEETVKDDIKAWKAARKRLSLKHLKGLYSDEEFLEMKDEINLNLIPKRIAKHDHQFEGLDIDIICAFMIALMTNLDKAWSMGSLQQRQAVQSLIFPKGVVYGDIRKLNPIIDPCFQLITSSKNSGTLWVTDGN